MEEDRSHRDGIDRRRFLGTAGAAVTVAYAAPSIARANLTPGLSPGSDLTLRVRFLLDCIDVLVMDLTGLSEEVAHTIWTLVYETSAEINAGDGPGAIADLQTLRAYLVANLAALNAAQGGLRNAVFSGEGGIGDGLVDTVDFLISLGPAELLTREVVLTTGAQAALLACDEDLAACRGIAYAERELPYPFLFVPEPLGSALFATGVQVVDGLEGNPPCYPALQACVATVVGSL